MQRISLGGDDRMKLHGCVGARRGASWSRSADLAEEAEFDEGVRPESPREGGWDETEQCVESPEFIRRLFEHPVVEVHRLF